MFEKFTSEAIQAINLAQEESKRLGHNFVGTEQILIGLIGEGSGIASKVLKSVGVNLKDSRVEVEKIIGRGSGFIEVEIPFTPKVKKILDFALDEAKKLNHNSIGTEHLLLGITREEKSIALRILENLNVNIEKLREMIFENIELEADQKEFSKEVHKKFYSSDLDGDIDLLGRIEDYSKVIKLNPNNKDAYLNRGLVKKLIKDYRGAIKDFTKAINLNHKNESIYFERAEAEDKLGNFRNAIRDYEKLITLNPNNKDALYLKMRTEFNIGDFENGKNNLENLIKKKYGIKQVLNQNEYKKEQLDPENDFAYFARGQLEYELGNIQGAIRNFIIAVKLNPNNKEARRKLKIINLGIKAKEIQERNEKELKKENKKISRSRNRSAFIADLKFLGVMGLTIVVVLIIINLQIS